MRVSVTRHAAQRYQQHLSDIIGNVAQKIGEKIARALFVQAEDLRTLGFRVTRNSSFVLFGNEVYVVEKDPQNKKFAVVTCLGRIPYSLQVRFLKENAQGTVLSVLSMN